MNEPFMRLNCIMYTEDAMKIFYIYTYYKKCDTNLFLSNVCDKHSSIIVNVVYLFDVTDYSEKKTDGI